MRIRLIAAAGLLAAVAGCAARQAYGARPHLGAPARVAVVSASATGTQLKEGLRAQVLLGPEQTGSTAVGLALIEIDLARSVPFHRHQGTEVLYLLEGDGELLGAGTVTTLNAREGAWLAPGAAHGFRATASTRALALYAPAGPERRYAGLDDPGTTPATAEVTDLKAIPRVFRPAVKAALSLPNGTGVARIGLDKAEVEATEVSCTLLELAPGATVPEHAHPDSAEVLYLFEGEGTLKVDGKEQQVKAPVALFLPPGAPHSFTVTSATAVRAVQWYTPPGPEQRFRP